jgi:hypothetical protein
LILTPRVSYDTPIPEPLVNGASAGRDMPPPGSSASRAAALSFADSGVSVRVSTNARILAKSLSSFELLRLIRIEAKTK